MDEPQDTPPPLDDAPDHLEPKPKATYPPHNNQKGGRHNHRILDDPALRAEVIGMLEDGMSRLETGRANCFHYNTFRNAMKRDPDFRRSVLKAEMTGKARLHKTLYTEARLDGALALKLLQCKYPDEWAKRRADEMTAERLAAVISDVAITMMAVTPNECHAAMSTALSNIMLRLQQQ